MRVTRLKRLTFVAILRWFGNSRVTQTTRRGNRGAESCERNMRNLLTVIAVIFMSSMDVAQAQPVTVDPESIVPLPDKFDIEMPAPDVPPEIARFHGAWVGTWADDNRHIL